MVYFSCHSERDLQKLKEEFWHQQMKIDEMNILKSELNIPNVRDNEFDDGKSNLNKDLKRKHKEISAGYYDLEGRFSEVS